jgi:multiple sugar transport system ATP-binding protein
MLSSRLRVFALGLATLLSAAVRVGRLVVAPGKLEIALEGDVAARVPSGADRITLGVRSEDIALGQGHGLEGQVYAVENHGMEKIVTLKVDEHALKATVPARMALEVDSTVSFTFNPRKLQFFDAQTGVNLNSGKEA